MALVGIFSSFTVISFKEIIKAMQSGNAAEIAQYFDQTVEINLPQKSGSYNKTESELVLKRFFQNNKVKEFEVIHKSENTSSQYCIGNLQTTKGTYRVTIYMKQKGGKQLIQELRFEK